MTHGEFGNHHHKPWSEWSVGAKTLAIAGGVVLVPGLFALVSAITMWLWNALMPSIFRLPQIGFWQAAGLIVLSHILFKGGMGGHRGRGHWRRARIREAMREGEGPAAPQGPAA